MKKPDFDKIIIKLLDEINKNIEGLVEDYRTEDTIEVHSENIPICIPPDVYKKICKELGSKSIGFMGIS